VRGEQPAFANSSTADSGRLAKSADCGSRRLASPCRFARGRGRTITVPGSASISIPIAVGDGSRKSGRDVNAALDLRC